MFIEHRTYTIRPGKTLEYLDLYGRLGWPAHSEHSICKGHYYSDVGQMCRVVSMWEYESLEDRAKRGAALRADPRWQEVMPQIASLVTDIQSNILLPSSFWKETQK
ncbi:NIPSNAP family protein [Burkholderia sp. BCC0405]|uniref:NIPSNAP family protein n=1 Tax=Burkholderia sp. BCC0405 TaxID=2676298 RepID=UPI00158E55FD|nr:NIPSNAP family protein [Burkholderia sp. BCC0405]